MLFRNFRKRKAEFLISASPMGWLLLFFIIPTLLVIAMAFRSADPYGGIGDQWTLDTLRDLRNPNYPLIIWRTVWLSVASTAICIITAIPASYYIARIKKRYQDIILLFIIVPFWINFLIRIFAWKVFLHPEGLFKQILVFLHIASPDSLLLYRPEAVLVVIVYSYLPFAILPIYAAAEKFDFHLMEAAYDLGASRLQAFTRIFIPGVRQGLLTAIIVVFIPALGSYVIPDIVGGPSAEMIGNKIAQRTFIDRNLPHASALSAILAFAVIVPSALALTRRFFKEKNSGSLGI
ncbi:MAG TPA: ABC transporter permease [Spirochaetota bacterium]|nr:ABC transporter permease [Spirochaetota bacterium]HPJ34220.1 ABC transporter permease [Spirochaetota bacterium]